VFDVVLAALAPLLALYLRNAQILSPFAADQVVAYVGISFVSTLIAFAVFRVDDGIPGYLSVHDVVALAKAVLAAELMICAAMFTITRLAGVPRSAPAIHALILGGGLFATRMLAHLADKNRKLAHRPKQLAAEYIILIGVNDLSGLFLKLIEAVGTQRRSVVGLLDENPRLTGRSLAGIPVCGTPEHLESLIDEYAVHGIGVDRVLIAGNAGMLSEAALAEVRRVCAQRQLALAFLGDLFNTAMGPTHRTAESPVASLALAASVEPARYFRWKRMIETLLALFLIMVAAPFWLAGAALAFVDVGSPILFWQRRIGLGGHPFQLYKIRTLHLAVDQAGRLLPEDQRSSWIGRLLRQSRVDELPQLLSVLVGDMALIGPRPLLPQDQPADPTVRLTVRPGITGWAQVNGGSLLTPEEKEVLDAWYVRHASPWLDLRIAAMTLFSLLRGDRRSERALAEARRDREHASARFAEAGAHARRGERPASMAQSA
jgi:lipopolysaccharide/colanic/teichoic acid biosynthesis glycosyltransferase